jgi:nicotinic acetylcholine receptor, invertebrate
LPLNSGDEELFSPGINDLSPNCCGDVSPTFEKPTYREMEKTMEASRFVAQHVKNKDKFEQVSDEFSHTFFLFNTDERMLENIAINFYFILV